MSEAENPVQKLWQDQPVEGIKMSAEEIRRRAGRFERKIRWRNIREYVASLIAVALLGYFFVTSHGVLFRTTFALFIAGMVVIVVQLHRKGAARSIPTGVDTLTSLRCYRAELQRQLDVVSHVWPWYLAPLVPGFVVYTVGYAITFPHAAAWAKLAVLDVAVAALFFCVWKMNMRAEGCLRRMIEELKGAEQ